MNVADSKRQSANPNLSYLPFERGGIGEIPRNTAKPTPVIDRRLRPRGIAATHLHLLMPTLVLPANQGSSTKTHRKVDAPARPSLNEGLSCSRSPLRNQ